MGKIRYPLASQFMSRDGSLEHYDSYIRNAYIDKHDDKYYVMKRPGTQLSSDFGVNAAGQGLFYFNGFVYAVINDILYLSSTGNAGANVTAFTQVTPIPWATRTSFNCLVFQNKMWIMGGNTTGSVNGDIWSTTDGVNWASNNSSPPFNNRVSAGAVVFNNQMWMIGGLMYPAGTYMNDVWSSPDGTTWTQVTAAAPWSARSGLIAIAAQNGIYIMGGNNGTPTYYNDVWFSSDGKNWQESTSAAGWAVRSGAVGLFFNNLLYIIGGFTTGTAYNDVWSSADGINWTSVTAAAFASGRSGMAGVIYNGKMWIMGGETVASVLLDDVYSSSNGSSWSLVTNTPGWDARWGLGAAVFQSPTAASVYNYPTIYVIAGTDHLSPTKDVWYANINTTLSSTYTLSPTTANQQYQFTTFVYGTLLVIKNQSNMWVLQAGTLIKVSDANYPAVTVPGMVVLNLFLYVMTPQGRIQACAINDPTTWPTLQFITYSYEDAPAIILSKYLNYIVEFKEYTTSFYYDNGNPAPGIPINPYTNANLRIGCVNAQTMVSMNNTLVFVGQTEQRGNAVMMLDGMSYDVISPTWVNRVLTNAVASGDSTRAIAFSESGHAFYVLILGTSTLALVYDFATQQWFVWDSGFVPPIFPYTHAITEFVSGGDLFLGNTTCGIGGKLYNTSTILYDDNGTAFTMASQTDKIDGKTDVRKFWGILDFIADVTAANVSISWTDDDYTTYSTPISVSLSTVRPRITRLGSSRRRAFLVTQTDSNPARWENLELTYSEGES